MKRKPYFYLIIALLYILTACSPVKSSAPPLEPGDVPVQNDDPVIEPTKPAVIDKVTVEKCPEAVPGTHQLIYAAKGVCFLYPEQYDVFQGEDGGLTFYVGSLLNTEAPLATLTIEAFDESIHSDLVAYYLPDVNLAVTTLEAIDMGGEVATVLDNLPGQDINRRVIPIHDGLVYNLMVARIGEEYGQVGQEAEALFRQITSTFQYIAIELDAPLLAGPECPEAPVGTTLFTNIEDGFCLLLPDGYAVDDSLISNEGGGETAVYIDSLQDVAHPRLFITVDEANGRSLQDLTAEKEAEISEIMGTPANWSFGYMLDGIPANQFNQVPGQDLGRQVLLVQNGRVITLTFLPDDPEAGDAFAEMETLYEIVMDSFSFLRQ